MYDEINLDSLFSIGTRGISVRRSGVQRRQVNRFAQHTYYYGFLTKLAGDALGPWFLEFECTDASWFNDTVENRMPNYDIDRLRQTLGDRDYWTAWDSSVGVRVVLRKFYETYRNLIISADNPAPLAIYSVELDREAADACIARADDGAQTLVNTGYWYGLDLVKTSLAATISNGQLIRADPRTDRLGTPEAYRLSRLQLLRSHPRPPRDPRHFRFEGMFRSQAVLQALHYTRGE